MRREVAASMIEHGFFENLDFRPNLLSQTEPVWIGISQLSDQPLYYWIAALPLRILKYTEVTTQLYAARLVSVVFFLGILAAGMGLVQEITGRAESPLVWLVPLTVALIPGVQDIMSAVNNDVGAAFFFTLFLWGSARLVRRGPRGMELVWVAAAAAACYFTKPTVYAALFLLPVVLLFSIFRQKRARIAWVIALAGGLVLLVGVTGWGDAAAWTSDKPQAGQNRTQISSDQDQSYALVMKLSPTYPRNILLQALSLDQRNALKGDLVTLAGWAWSDRSALVEVGLNSRNGVQIIQPLTTTKEKQYFIAQLDVPEAIDYPWLELRAWLAEGERDVQVYFTDLVLLTGEISREEVRELSSLQGRPGVRPGGHSKMDYPTLQQSGAGSACGAGCCSECLWKLPEISILPSAPSPTWRRRGGTTGQRPAPSSKHFGRVMGGAVFHWGEISYIHSWEWCQVSDWWGTWRYSTGIAGA
jgi:hypothetical protein